jgi:hypothetical protein
VVLLCEQAWVIEVNGSQQDSNWRLADGHSRHGC